MLVIRKYQNADRKCIRRICWNTAYSGEPAEGFFYGREILSDLLTLYYTEYEPESIFIAELDGQIIGYLTGCKDVKKKRRIFITKVIPFITIRFIFSGAILKKKNILFIYSCTLSFLKKEFFTTDFSSEYPAILHINIDAKYRGIGIGRKLIDEYINYLKKEKIKGVHITTVSANAVRFFEKMKFSILETKKVSYIKCKKSYRFIMGRKLSDDKLDL